MEQVVEAFRGRGDQDGSAVVARIVEVEGFSTRPGDDLVAIESGGTVHGSLLAGLGIDTLVTAARSMLSDPNAELLRSLTIDVHDKEANSAGLACGGRAHLLLQSSSSIPDELWALLACRAPVALVTPLDGGTGSSVVDRNGRSWGTNLPDRILNEAVSLLASGRTDRRRIEHPEGQFLIEAWVPEPRIVVVGGGELVEAIKAQAGLLGWETRSSPGRDELGPLLEWAGDTGALVVLSHDPHVDSPALAEGLQKGTAYVGALGSRATQARRTERLLASGVEQADLDRIHRPIGLDLGGRKAPEVALAIIAEILAAHCGRNAMPLSQRDGPIH